MTFDEFMQDPVNTLYAFSEEELRNIKRKISEKNLQQLQKLAEEALSLPLQSVTYKEEMILVKDKHDYESFSIYSWPNPDTKDGLPYIKRDGYQNPMHLRNDKLALRKVSYAAYYLGLLYYITRSKKYYLRLKEHLYCFFIRKGTRMNPNLNHGQAMPGINTGQRGGIIDFAVSFGYALSILQGLKSEGLLESDLFRGLEAWLKEFNHWLTESEFGKEMKKCTNNHSLVYDYLQLIISIFLDDYYMMITVKTRYPLRMKEQILPNGEMPLELKRVNSQNYYFMNLKLFIEIGKLLCLNLKNYSLLSRAVEFYEKEHLKWRFNQAKPFTKLYDNYFYYCARQYFGIKDFSLKKAKSLQYIILVDIYGGEK